MRTGTDRVFSRRLLPPASLAMSSDLDAAFENRRTKMRALERAAAVAARQSWPAPTWADHTEAWDAFGLELAVQQPGPSLICAPIADRRFRPPWSRSPVLTPTSLSLALPATGDTWYQFDLECCAISVF